LFTYQIFDRNLSAIVDNNSVHSCDAIVTRLTVAGVVGVNWVVAKSTVCFKAIKKSIMRERRIFQTGTVRQHILDTCPSTWSKNYFWKIWKTFRF